jgi:hypothetical protein
MAARDLTVRAAAVVLRDQTALAAVHQSEPVVLVTAALLAVLAEPEAHRLPVALVARMRTAAVVAALLA